MLVLNESRAAQFDDDLTGIHTIIVPDALFATVCDTATPQGMMAVFSFPEVAELTSIPELVVVADGIQDPGNLGTLIRSAAALGATRVICAKGTVDPWSSKVVRAAASAVFQIPVVGTADLGDALRGVSVRVADVDAPARIDEVDWTGPCAIVVGSEGGGIVSDFSALETELVSIPMFRPVESLNAGVAASIVLYEVARQRTPVADQ
jgi:TrmH family RNA methyltransferase